MSEFYASYPVEGSGGSIVTGDLTDVGTDGITITNGTGAVVGSGTQIAQHVADATHNGYLSSANWSTFNSKQSALTIGNLTDVGTDGITVTGGTGAVIGSGTSIAQHVADASHNGYLSSTDWSTFNSKQAALTIGNLTDAGTDGITVTGGTGAVIGSGTSIAQHVADATHNGYLSSSDWSTFNSKQAAGNYITALTGDVAASGPGSAAATIQAGAVDNSKVSATAAIAFSKLAALTSAHILVGNGSNVATDVAVSGDISLTNAGVTAYSGTVPLNKGGTGQTTKAPAFDALSPMSTLGDVIYGGASGTGTALAGNTTSTKKFLTQTGNGSVSAAPGWNTIVSGDLPAWTTSNAGAVVKPSSYVVSDTGNGYGSTATKVRRFTNNTVTGSDISCTGNDATNGTKYTINAAGIYGITYTDSSTSNSNFGIGINASVTTNVDSLSPANRACMSFAISTAARQNCAATLVLAVNDVITPQADGSVNSTGDSTQFTITQIVRF